MQQIRWFDVVLALVGAILAFVVPTIRTFLYEVVRHPLTSSGIPQGNRAAPIRTASTFRPASKTR
jgi:hypothetical protein